MKFLSLFLSFFLIIGVSFSGSRDTKFFNQEISRFRDLLETGDSRSALDILSRLETKYPDHEGLRSWFSYFYQVKGRGEARKNRYDLAIKDFRKALKYQSSESNKVLLASALVSHKDYFEAAVFMEKHLQSMSLKFRQYFLKECAHCYLQLQNYKAAIYFLKNLIFENPGDTAAMNQLALAYLKNGDNNSALDIFEKIGKIRPLSTSEKALVQQAMGSERVKEKYRTVVSSSFEIQIDNQKYESYLYFILEILERAYMDLGRVYHYYPDHKTRVRVLTDEDFNHITGTDERILGLQTGSSNELFIRFGKSIDSSKKDELKKVLWHEYNHHLLLLKTKGLGKIPHWFAEGIAVFYEPGYELQSHRERLEKLREKDLLFHSKNLPGRMTHYSMYVMASTMVYLLDYQGDLNSILIALKSVDYRYGFEDLFQEITSKSTLEFTDDWNRFIREYLMKREE